MNEEIHARIRALIHAANHVVVLAHIRPDGDAIGSVLGLGLALKAAGKQVTFLLKDGVPADYRFLTGADEVVKQLPEQYDLVIACDSSDLQRTGGVLGDRIPDINLDHHITNLNFAQVNLVEPHQVATAALLAEHLPAWGLEITPPVAAALLTGLVSDSLGFRTSNMTPAALRLAAVLMEHGADLPDIYQRALNQRSYNAIRYWGVGLSKIEREKNLVWTSLTREDRKKIHYPGNDDADLINVLASIEEAHVAVIFVEQPGKKVKVSWRCKPGLNVSAVALEFGGGGHPAAAGAEIEGTLDEVKYNVLKTTRSILAL